MGISGMTLSLPETLNPPKRTAQFYVAGVLDPALLTVLIEWLFL